MSRFHRFVLKVKAEAYRRRIRRLVRQGLAGQLRATQKSTDLTVVVSKASPEKIAELLIALSELDEAISGDVGGLEWTFAGKISNKAEAAR